VSGVIQGSVLGQLLVLLYINDVTDIFGGSCVGKLYTDDIKLYSVLDNPLDYSDLQNNLNDLQQWCDRFPCVCLDLLSFHICPELFPSLYLSSVASDHLHTVLSILLSLPCLQLCICTPHMSFSPKASTHALLAETSYANFSLL